VELLVGDSRAVLGWLRELGLRLRLMYDRQSYAVDGRHVFWGGLHAVPLVEPGRNMAGAPAEHRTSRSMRYSRRSGTFGGRERARRRALARARVPR
jgi:hypothetical protein